jgi:hypothetical protein
LISASISDRSAWLAAMADTIKNLHPSGCRFF